MVLKTIGLISCWVIMAWGAGILMLYIAALARLRSWVWPKYDLRILWDELHLRPWNAQETIDSALALVPTLPLWVIAAFVGSSMYIVGSVAYGAISALYSTRQKS
jgi:hypothetical protein